MKIKNLLATLTLSLLAVGLFGTALPARAETPTDEQKQTFITYNENGHLVLVSLDSEGYGWNLIENVEIGEDLLTQITDVRTRGAGLYVRTRGNALTARSATVFTGHAATMWNFCFGNSTGADGGEFTGRGSSIIIGDVATYTYPTDVPGPDDVITHVGFINGCNANGLWNIQ